MLIILNKHFVNYQLDYQRLWSMLDTQNYHMAQLCITWMQMETLNHILIRI